MKMPFKKKPKVKYPELSYDAFEYFEKWDKMRNELSKRIKTNKNTKQDYEEFRNLCDEYNKFLVQNNEKLIANNVTNINDMREQLITDYEFCNRNIMLLNKTIEKKRIEDKTEK